MDSKPLVALDVAPEDKVVLTRLLENICSVVCTHTIDELMSLLEHEAVDVVLTDLALRSSDMAGLVSLVRNHPSSPRIIVLCDVESMPTAMSAMGTSVDDLVVRGHGFSELCGRVDRLLQRRRSPSVIRSLPEFSRNTLVWGCSAQMREIRGLVHRLASLSMPLLIVGETGSGKEVLARFIHAQSSRSGGSFVPVNVAAIPPDLVESTLFGHERGAFTGAVANHPGKMAQAHDGTLFLDEIGDMRLDLQSKLLRAVEEKQCVPVGGHREVPTDVRLISATNMDLRKAAAQGTFRRDLFYRINVVTLRIPPLRERVADIPLLLTHFIRLYGEEFRKPIRDVAPEVMEMFLGHAWPGNVRELQNKVQRAVALCSGSTLKLGDVLEPSELDPQEFVQERSGRLCTMDAMEEAYIREVLRQTAGRQNEAARILGIDPKTLYKRMLKYGLTQPRSEPQKTTRLAAHARMALVQ